MRIPSVQEEIVTVHGLPVKLVILHLLLFLFHHCFDLALNPSSTMLKDDLKCLIWWRKFYKFSWKQKNLSPAG